MGADWYRFVTVAEEQRPLLATGGLHVYPEAGLEMLTQAGTIIIPGWRTDAGPPAAAVKQALSQAYARGARLVSICSGAFLLAACGLLAGRRATTHWLYADRLQALYPDVEVNPDVLYVDAEQILTSAGSAADLDEISRSSGFGNPAALRHHLRRRVGLTPTAYRASFRAA
jgi:AraC family transcriptional regulator, transcriptional activator FtrA